jgi:hypothetical protein
MTRMLPFHLETKLNRFSDTREQLVERTGLRVTASQLMAT